MSTPFDIGERVRDQDDEDPDEAIVVNMPPVPAEEWDIEPLDKTLAEANPSYEPDAPTVIVVFQSLLDILELSEWPHDEPVPCADLLDAGIQFYAFPAPRLASVDTTEDESSTNPSADGDESSGDTDIASTAGEQTDGGTNENETPPAAVETLRDQLAERDLSPEIAADGQTVVVEKLGETYRVHPNGEVDGNGAIADQLEEFVK